MTDQEFNKAVSDIALKFVYLAIGKHMNVAVAASWVAAGQTAEVAAAAAGLSVLNMLGLSCSIRAV